MSDHYHGSARDIARRFMLAEWESTVGGCGEISCTQLAELAADEFDWYDETAEDEYGIPEWLFELALEVADLVESDDRSQGV